jgi:hypothetical protein
MNTHLKGIPSFPQGFHDPPLVVAQHGAGNAADYKRNQPRKISAVPGKLEAGRDKKIINQPH